MQNGNIKLKVFDIKFPSIKAGEGLIIDLRKRKSKNERVGKKIKPLIEKKNIVRKEILKDLIKLEIQEQNRRTETEKLLPKDELVFISSDKISFKDENKKRMGRLGVSVFVIASLAVSLIVPGFILYQNAQSVREQIFESVGEAISNIKQASQDIADSNFEGAIQEFNNAQVGFSGSARKLDSLGAGALRFVDWLPGVSLIPAAQQAMRAGEYLTQAAQELITVANLFTGTDFNIYSNDGSEKNNSLVQAIIDSREHLKIAQEKLSQARLELSLINTGSLESGFKTQIQKFREALLQIQTRLNKSDRYAESLLKILGSDTPKLYLFIFQNNQELRATGGFIGTYGLFKIDNGRIEKVLVDGIYNPDGQLKEKIIPPSPLWKISPNWGLRDANWFADFPTSAKKIVWFYEKTGGPTVDGVVSFTSTVMERLLKVIGPIEMSQYGVTVTAQNFIEITQRQVELDYDKETNKPKQFLTDLTPIVLERVFSAPKEKLPEIFKVFSQNLKERHTMLYFLNEDLEKLVLDEGLGGALKDAPKDYLNVVNSNIDGRKTDGIIDNEIYHRAQIQDDDSVVDTVTIKRTHKGGQELYDWWNAENKDFLRVYVPKGSEFLEADGFSRETPAPLLGVDYSEYKKDGLVENIEQGQRQDEKSGTWIFEETGKTVFGNWVYTGPGKTNEVSFKYKLPFKANQGLINNYSLLVQKQAGTIGDKLFTSLILGDNDNVVWQYPELKLEDKQLKTESLLDTDKFYGVVLSKK